MKKSLLGLAAGVVGVVLASSGPAAAAAAPSPRLVGTFASTFTVTSTTYGTVGARYSEQLHFSPKCATGPCTTRAAYTPNEVGLSHVRLTPAGSTYAGRGTYTAACFDQQGNVIDFHGYNVAETLSLTVLNTTQGKATDIRGTDKTVTTLTDSGRQANCDRQGTVVYSVAGTRV